MRIAFPEEGGVLIEGDQEELTEFAGQIAAAIAGGESRETLLTTEGTEPVTIVCVDG